MFRSGDDPPPRGSGFTVTSAPPAGMYGTKSHRARRSWSEMGFSDGGGCLVQAVWLWCLGSALFSSGVR